MKKPMYFANFNVTFGEKQAPLLDYFDDIVYPAFTSNLIRRRGKDTEYFFDSIDIIEFKKGEFVLIGRFIKNTIVNIKSQYSASKGLYHTNQTHPTAPYSIFALFLKNHRVVLVKNQNESPALSSFNATVRDIFKLYRQEENKNRDTDEKLPYPIVHIVGLPFEGTVKEKLKDVSKVEKLIIRKYPVNGDIPFLDLFSDLTDSLGSKTSRAIFNSPDDFDKIAEVVGGSSGTIRTELDVRYKDGGFGRLKDDDFTQQVHVDLKDDEEFNKSIKSIVDFASERPELQKCSEENAKIYLRNQQKIKANI